MSEMDIHEALIIIHDTKALVSNSCWKIYSLEDPSFLKDIEKIQRAICNIEGKFIYFLFDRINLVEVNECLHEYLLNNNEDIHNLKIQNEQLLKRFQDTCSSSYVSDCHMVDCLEYFHDMIDLEKHENLQVLDVF